MEREWLLEQGFLKDWIVSWLVEYHDAPGSKRRELEQERATFLASVDMPEEKEKRSSTWREAEEEARGGQGWNDVGWSLFLSGLQIDANIAAVTAEWLGIVPSFFTGEPNKTISALHQELLAQIEQRKPRPSVASEWLELSGNNPAVLVALEYTGLVNRAATISQLMNPNQHPSAARAEAVSWVTSLLISYGSGTPASSIVPPEIVGLFEEHIKDPAHTDFAQDALVVARRLDKPDVRKAFTGIFMPGEVDPEAQDTIDASLPSAQLAAPVVGTQDKIRKLLAALGAGEISPTDPLIAAMAGGLPSEISLTHAFGAAGGKYWHLLNSSTSPDDLDGLPSGQTNTDLEAAITRVTAETPTLLTKKQRDEFRSRLPELYDAWRDAQLPLPAEKRKTFEEFFVQDIISSATGRDSWLAASNEDMKFQSDRARLAIAQVPGAGAFIRLGVDPATAQGLVRTLEMHDGEAPAAYMARLSSVLPELLFTARTHDSTATLESVFQQMRSDGGLPPTIDQLFDILDNDPGYASLVQEALTTGDYTRTQAIMGMLAQQKLVTDDAWLLAGVPADIAGVFQAKIDAAVSGITDPAARALRVIELQQALPELQAQFETQIPATTVDRAAIYEEEKKKYLTTVAATPAEGDALAPADYAEIQRRTSVRVAAQQKAAQAGARQEALVNFASRQAIGPQGFFPTLPPSAGGTPETTGLIAGAIGGHPLSGSSRAKPVPTFQDSIREALLAHVRTLPEAEQAEALEDLFSQAGRLEAEFAVAQPRFISDYQAAVDAQKAMLVEPGGPSEQAKTAFAAEEAALAAATTQAEIDTITSERAAREKTAAFAFTSGRPQQPEKAFLAQYDFSKLRRPKAPLAPGRTPTITRRF